MTPTLLSLRPALSSQARPSDARCAEIQPRSPLWHTTSPTQHTSASRRGLCRRRGRAWCRQTLCNAVASWAWWRHRIRLPRPLRSRCRYHLWRPSPFAQRRAQRSVWLRTSAGAVDRSRACALSQESGVRALTRRRVIFSPAHCHAPHRHGALGYSNVYTNNSSSVYHRMFSLLLQAQLQDLDLALSTGA